MAYARTWVVAKAAEKAAGLCPCKGCEERTPGCAGACKKGYPAWKQRVSEIRKEMLEQDKGERVATAYQRESYDKAVRSHEVQETKWGSRSKRSKYT